MLDEIYIFKTNWHIFHEILEYNWFKAMCYSLFPTIFIKKDKRRR